MSSAELWDVSLDAYHADGARSVSHSELECFLDDPVLYRDRYLLGTAPRESSEALEFGQLFHGILAGDPWGEFVVIPESALTSNGQRRGKAWDAFKAEHSGKVLITAEQERVLNAMLLQVYGNPRVLPLLTAEGSIEQSIRWQDPETGLTCRCRPDKMTTFCANDWKTIDINPLDSHKLAGHIESYGYHRQAAFYVEGIKALTGEDFPFLFTFCRKKPSYSVRVVDLERDWIEAGRQENRQALRQLADAKQSGEWVHEHSREITTLSRPFWGSTKQQWSLS